MKNTGEKGITLIALIITIIVMLILAGVTIAAVVNGGLFDQAKTAGDETKKKEIEEEIAVFIGEYGGEKYTNSKSRSMAEFLESKGCEIISEDEDELVIEYKDYEITISKDTGKITDIGKATELRIKLPRNVVYNAETEIATITVKPEIRNSNGLTVQSIKIEGGAEKAGTEATFEVEENGTYKFIIKLSNGEAYEKSITVTEIKRTTIGESFKDDNTGRIKIGDYVNYNPYLIDSTSISYLVDGSRSTSSPGNSTANQTHDIETLQWRVLDKTSDGRVRLISATPTTFTLVLQGANGYNNGVLLIDEVCAIYGGTKGTAQGLKIEDIQKHTTYNYTQYANAYVDPNKYGGTAVYTANASYYPNLFAQEKTGWVLPTQGTALDLSSQTSFVTGMTQAGAVGIKITQTSWTKTMSIPDWRNSMYQTLFMGHPDYWLSSRCVSAGKYAAWFNVRKIRNSTEVSTETMLESNYPDATEYRCEYCAPPCNYSKLGCPVKWKNWECMEHKII